MLPLLYGRFSIISFHGLGDPPLVRLLFQSVGIFAISLAQCGNGVAAAPSVLTGHQILRHATVAVPKISGLFLRCLVASWRTCMSHGAAGFISC